MLQQYRAQVAGHQALCTILFVQCARRKALHLSILGNQGKMLSLEGEIMWIISWQAIVLIVW